MNTRRESSLLLGVAAVLLASAVQAANETPALDAESGPNCVSLMSIRSTKVLDDRTILFEMNGNKNYVNRLPMRCPGLKFEKRFMYKTSLNQLCGQDIITVLTDWGRGASCGLGRFEAYVEPEKVDGGEVKGELKPAPEKP